MTPGFKLTIWNGHLHVRLLTYSEANPMHLNSSLSCHVRGLIYPSDSDCHKENHTPVFHTK